MHKPVLSVIGSEYDVTPFYTLVDSVTLEPFVPNIFDVGTVAIQFDKSTTFTELFSIGAKTTKSAHAGQHEVKLKVKRTATSAAFYTDPFVITVIDPCNPIVCEEVSFFPSEDVAPADMVLVVNGGQVIVESAPWTSSHGAWCSDSKVWSACGAPTFSLIDADTGLPITDFIWKIDHSSKRLQLQGLVMNEELRGNIYNVYILGDSDTGISGTSLPFKVTISTEIIEDPDYFPSFDVFPPSFTHYITEGVAVAH